MARVKLSVDDRYNGRVSIFRDERVTYLLIYIKGLLMGCADLVPGVSGGTVALITGIYQRLINAIAAFNGDSFILFIKGRWGQLWKQVDGWFLLALFGGMLSAIFLLASGIKYLLLNHPVLTWSFFFGLIVSSAFLLVVKNRTNNPINVLWLAFGAFLGYWLSTQQMHLLPDGAMGVFLAGFIAITAMILPGISGSLILILLGQYERILQAVELLDWRLLMLFGFGCVLGLLVFSAYLEMVAVPLFQSHHLCLGRPHAGDLV